MAEYKFKIGDFYPKAPKAPNDAPRGAYQIIRRLPAAEGDFQYVIRSPYEDHQRVAKAVPGKAKRVCTGAHFSGCVPARKRHCLAILQPADRSR
jgi:hypothetical protein